MKLKQVKMLCMITAVSAAMITGALEAGGEAYGNRESKKAEADLAEAAEKDSMIAGGIFELPEHAAVSERMLPEVSAGQNASEEEAALEPEITEEAAEEPAENAWEESRLIIADVTNYVNIRSLPGEEGEILGKLYDDSIGTQHGEENGWYYITSGKVTGYVKAEYVLTGEAAEKRAAEAGVRLAEVTTETLKVRKSPTTESIVLGLVPGGDVLAVLEETEGWIKISAEEEEGYVSADYVRVYTENTEAESREEEEARLRKEDEAQKKAEEAARKAIAGQNQNSGNSGKSQKSGTASGGSSGTGGRSVSGSGCGTGSSNTSSDTELGQQIVNYALQFVGNPYVYGGTSLTEGADCSGFVMSVFANFGISLPRTSGEQGASGSAVSGVENAKAGDLVWYSGHIGIYIGNSQIVHASSSKNGIIVSGVNFGKILGIRRIV